MRVIRDLLLFTKAPRLCSPRTVACFRDDDVPLCLSEDRICDGARDCKDGRDEYKCPGYSTSNYSTRSGSQPPLPPMINLQENNSKHSTTGSSKELIGTTQLLWTTFLCLTLLGALIIVCLACYIAYRTKIPRPKRKTPSTAHLPKKTYPTTSATSAEPIYEKINDCELKHSVVVSSNQSVYDASGSSGYISISEASSRSSLVSSRLSTCSSGYCVASAISGEHPGEVMVVLPGGEQGARHSAYAEVSEFSRGNQDDTIGNELPLKQPSLFYPEIQHNYMSLSGVAKKDSDASEYEPLMQTCDTAATILEITPLDLC